jgi:hypothetical protein
MLAVATVSFEWPSLAQPPAMRPPSREAVFTAKVSGLLAGAAMLVVLVLRFLATGRGVLVPLQFLTALAAGEQALTQVSVLTVLPGLLAHFLGPSLFWARLFGLMVGYAPGRVPPWTALLLGLLIGTLAQCLDVYLFMPYLQRQLHGQNLWKLFLPGAWSWGLHLVYGATLGLAYWRLQPRHTVGTFT